MMGQISNQQCKLCLSFYSVNHKDDHIMEKTDMPDELVRNVNGEIIFEQVMPQVAQGGDMGSLVGTESA